MNKGAVSTEHYEVVNGIKLAFEQTGSGHPCLLLHGNRDCKENFRELAPLLAEACGLEVISIDFKGHGNSDKPDTGYSIDLFVEEIAGFIRNKGFDKVHLIGHSLGSTVSIALVDRYPELVDRLVLMGASVGFKVKFQRPEFTRENFKRMLQETNKRAAPYFFVEGYEEVKNRVLDQWLRMEYHVHMNLIQLQHPDLTEAAGRIRNKTLLIYGEMDKSTPPSDGEIVQRLVGDAHLAIIPGTGHFMYMEEPYLVANEITPFLIGG
ncbi:alpha/beta hydrolase [Gorillibacterium sp. CAU 1737]|uniref:alpha/beta fold hydrolase n=1 Tax=Gorillibacterium sp. CAU 1737 TaxID=3140362 RepID=UPI0032616124